MRKHYLIAVLISIGFLANAQKYAQVENHPIFDGNDLISYYDGEVIKGKKEITTTYDGLLLYFSSQENLKRFESSPEKYMPEFGGWCSTAMAMNTLLVPNYNFYKVEDDKLLFFAIQAFLNAHTLWERDSVGNYENAQANYAKILENEAAGN